MRTKAYPTITLNALMLVHKQNVYNEHFAIFGETEIMIDLSLELSNLMSFRQLKYT